MMLTPWGTLVRRYAVWAVCGLFAGLLVVGTHLAWYPALLCVFYAGCAVLLYLYWCQRT